MITRPGGGLFQAGPLVLLPRERLKLDWEFIYHCDQTTMKQLNEQAINLCHIFNTIILLKL